MPYLANLDSSGGGGGGTVQDIVTTTPAILTITNPTGPIVTIDSTIPSSDILLDGTIQPGELLIGMTAPNTVEAFSGSNDNDRLYWNTTTNAWETSFAPRLGTLATTVGTQSVAVGNEAAATAGSIAIGYQALTSGPNQINIQTLNRSIRMLDPDYIQLNGIDSRYVGRVVTRWLAPNISLPLSINLPMGVNVELPLPSFGSTGTDPNFNMIAGGVEYVGSVDLSANIFISVMGGRQAPGRMWAEVGVTGEGVISTILNVDRYRSNGQGVCSTLTLCTRFTISPGGTIKVWLRQQQTPGTLEFNYCNAVLVIT